MLIRDDEIATWEQLQSHVACLFRQMGYHADTPCVVELAGRGKKEIDVFVEDRRTSVATRILIECKWWNSSIPQDIVHSFHTVLHGVGANYGFIISRRGFQSGAKEAVANTPITLLTFEELQHQFGDEWFRAQWAKVEQAGVRLREAFHLYFDQQNAAACTFNNRFFWSEEFENRFLDAGAECVRLLSQLASRWPESYLGPVPVLMATDPLNPLADPEDGAWHSVATVREYFARLCQGIVAWTEKFDALVGEAQARADADPVLEEEQFNRSLVAFREEMPIRVLSQHMSAEDYRRILDLVSRPDERAEATGEGLASGPSPSS